MFLLSRTFSQYIAWIDKSRKKVICTHLSIYFQTFAGSSLKLTIHNHFLKPLFSSLSNCITPKYQGKRPDCVKEPQIKRRYEGRKGETSQETEEREGKQGFQISYWSGVRWTFNLTNQLPNYTRAARMVYPMHFYVCVIVCVAG